AMEAGEYIITCEAIPGRGCGLEKPQEELLEEARGNWATGRVHAVSITDCPSGNPALMPEYFAQQLLDEGIVPLVHFTCKDRNRNQAEAQYYGMQRVGIENLLVMTGDYNGTGWMGQPRPVFDLDPVTMIQQVQSFNRGMGYPNFKGDVERTQAGTFFPGCVVSPFKWTEGETMTQLFKLKKKVAAGAQFCISQVGFSARKLQEMLWLMEDNGIDVPLIANIYVINAGHGGAMNRGGIPGCDVTDEFLQILKDERDNSEDKGLEARLQRAAKMIAISKGLGCRGVHIGGVGCSPENVSRILDLADQYESNWQEHLEYFEYPQDNCFYYYKKDPETGLNLREPNPLTESYANDRKVQGNYGLSRFAHHFVFMPKKGVNGIFTSRERSLEAKKGRNRAQGIEHLGKVFMYACMDCGDCGLYATAYSCPMVKCPKCQRNGPCGGSKDGWCEVYPGEKYCVWFKAYHRLKPHGETDTLQSYIVPPNNWANVFKSPWGAQATGLDGYARRQWVLGFEPDEEAKNGVQPNDNAPKDYS
ncbi:MAG: methylenetetrahydrofolate reductase C-terminal domain-containing protein, partial [Eggerthellaceae bacterium]|nr:methylenetetrahydrofolate reductase C-terminal domain-containing protein [Eggerthellaceae bacterium]